MCLLLALASLRGVVVDKEVYIYVSINLYNQEHSRNYDSKDAYSFGT